MENKNIIEIGYLEIFSWEHFAATNHRSCYGVEQLEWILPDETTDFFLNFLSLWQETLLQSCIPLSPLVDGGNNKRTIYLKSKSFKKRLKKDSLEFFKQLPAAALYLNVSDIYFSSFIDQDDFNLGQIPEWDDYVLKNSGYATGRFHGEHNKFWVPKSDEKINGQYSVFWRKHHFQDKILGQILENNNQQTTNY